MGRRIEKKVYDWHDQAGDWEATPSLHRKFVWGGNGGSFASGWLLLLELDCGTGDPPVETVVRKSTWGLDLAGMSGQSRDRKGAGMLGQSRDRKGADAAYGAAALQGAGGTLDKTLSRQGQVGGLLAVLNAAEEPGHNEIGIMSRFFEYVLVPPGPNKKGCTGDFRLDMMLQMDGWYGECKARCKAK